jgi:hypothetical protein
MFYRFITFIRPDDSWSMRQKERYLARSPSHRIVEYSLGHIEADLRAFTSPDPAAWDVADEPTWVATGLREHPGRVALWPEELATGILEAQAKGRTGEIKSLITHYRNFTLGERQAFVAAYATHLLHRFQHKWVPPMSPSGH